MKKIVSLILSLALIAALALSLTSCGGACEYADTRNIEGRDIHYVEISVKDYGKIVVLLDATTAPVTVANFLKLVNEGFYDGLTFHRIMEGFMIQGGDPKGNGSGGSEDSIKGEFALNGHANDISHIKGVISMARGTSYNSASSQFFICNDDARSSLDGSYAAFGYVVKGLNVVDKITSGALNKCMKYYGSEELYNTWLYYGNGHLTSDYDMFSYFGGTPTVDYKLEDCQPVIEYIREVEA